MCFGSEEDEADGKHMDVTASGSEATVVSSQSAVMCLTLVPHC